MSVPRTQDRMWHDVGGEGVFAIPFGPEFGRGLQYPLLGTCTVTDEIACHGSMAGLVSGQLVFVPSVVPVGESIHT